MDKRSKILAGVFGVVVAYALLAGVVYPTWIKPLLTLDERIAERQKDLDKLLKEDEAVQNARLDYKNWAARIGAFDAGKVETDVRERLNHLLERYKLADAGVTPSRPVEDRKTGHFASTISVSAVGTLEAAVAFLKEVYELPHLTRVANVSISPVGGGKKGSEKDRRVSLRVPIETWVLPQNRVVGPLDPATLTRTETFVRHQAQNYKSIADALPFWDWVPPVPLAARIVKPVNVLINEPGVLEATISGGDGEYTYVWSPEEGLKDPKSLRTEVDTSKAGTTAYTLTVADGTGNSITASTSVVVREVPKQPEPVAVKPQPVPVPVPVKEVRQRWPDGRSREIKMALLCTMGGEKLNQFMVFNNKSKQNEYYKVGDEFDGGKLEFVHQYGGVVSWKDDYFAYPLGFSVDQGLEIKAANEYPELQLAAEAIKKQKDAAAAELAAQKAAEKKPEIEKPPGIADGAPLQVVPPNPGAAPPGNAAPAPAQPAVQPEPNANAPVAVPVEQPAGGVQMTPLITDADPSPTDGQMGPPNPEPAAPKVPVRPRPKVPSRPVTKPRP